MKSFIVVTDNSRDYIENVLWSLLPLQDNEELIIFDNLSTDESVPKIIGKIDPMMWLDDNQKYKFYINKQKESIEETINKAKSIARGTPIVIDKKERFNVKEVLECYE